MKLPLNIIITILTCTFLATVSCRFGDRPFWTEEKSPKKIARLVTEDLFSRPDFMMYETDFATAVHYAEVGTAFGSARFAGLMDNEQTIERLSQRYRKVIEDNIPNTANHVDVNVYGVLPLELYMQTGDKAFFRQGMALADSQWADPLPGGLTSQTRYWIDDIWMIGALQTQAYRATGKKVYLDRAATETVVYLNKLQQPTGLFHHGEEAPFFWGRGNGWVAAGLAELLSELPENHPHYQHIKEGYTTMMDALLTYQAADGMWRQLIDNPSSWKETSSSAMFGYAFAVGVKRGILPEEKFKPAYQKTWLTLTDYITDEGKMTEVCAGTGQSTDINYYLNRPRVTGDFHGQAPVLWFAYALMMD